MPSAKREKSELPAREEFYVATVNVLKTLGGPVGIEEIERQVSDLLQLSPRALSEPHGDGRSQFQYDLAWVRTYLKWVGAVENTGRGSWRLTDTGEEMSDEQLRGVPREVRRRQRAQQFLQEMPSQEGGPRFALRRGALAFAGATGNNGNDLGRIAALHPLIKEVSRNLVEALSRDSGLWPSLERAAVGYEDQVNQDASSVDYSRLYGQGVLLTNAIRAAQLQPQYGNSFPLPHDTKLLADTLVDLHGPFILGTAAGQLLQRDAERYSASPEQGIEERKVDRDISVAVSSAGAPTTPEVRLHIEEILDVEEPGEKRDSYLSGISRNAAIVLVGGASAYVLAQTGLLLAAPTAIAAFAAGVFGPEALKKSKIGSELTRHLSSLVDDTAMDFVLQNRDLLRTLSERKGMEWIAKAIDWVEENASRPQIQEGIEITDRPLKVLIIEPDASNAARILTLVTSWGFEVTNISTGALSAVASARALPPDVIVAETVLGARSGIEAVREIMSEQIAVALFVTDFPEKLLTEDRPDPVYLVAKPFTDDHFKNEFFRAISELPVGRVITR